MGSLSPTRKGRQPGISGFHLVWYSLLFLIKTIWEIPKIRGPNLDPNMLVRILIIKTSKPRRLVLGNSHMATLPNIPDQIKETRLREDILESQLGEARRVRERWLGQTLVATTGFGNHTIISTLHSCHVPKRTQLHSTDHDITLAHMLSGKQDLGSSASRFSK